MTGFRQLQALHAVINAGTVTGAGHALGISQPGISNLLSQLEAQTRLQLFRRSRGRMQPTPEAMVLYHEFDTVLRGFEQISQTVLDLQGHRVGHLQVVGTHALSHGFLPRLLGQFLASQPEVTVAFDARSSPQIQEWVVSNLFEVGITELPVRHDHLEQEIMQFECECALPANSPLAKLEVITPTDLDGVPFVALANDHSTHHRIQEAFVEARSRLRIRCQVHLFRAALDLVKQGIGVALVDPFTLDHDDGRGYLRRRFEPGIVLDMAIIHSASRPLSRIAGTFVDQLREEMLAVSIGGPARDRRAL